MGKKPEKKPQPKTEITGCTLIGVQWDGQAIEAVCATARALENLTQLFRSQNIRIDAMIKVGGDGNDK
jgi:hypothetical protein